LQQKNLIDDEDRGGLSLGQKPTIYLHYVEQIITPQTIYMEHGHIDYLEKQIT
jgi:hypothetical protein